jgi:hypothetical protein
VSSAVVWNLVRFTDVLQAVTYANTGPGVPYFELKRDGMARWLRRKGENGTVA